MTSHRRPGLLERLRSRRRATASEGRPRPSIELVDGPTRVAHRVTSEELVTLHRVGGSCRALCGVIVVAASMTDPGRSRCRVCAS